MSNARTHVWRDSPTTIQSFYETAYSCHLQWRQIKPRTLSGYIYIWKSYLLPFWGPLPLERICPRSIEDWKRSHPLPRVATNRAIQQLAAMGRYAALVGELPAPPDVGACKTKESPQGKALSPAQRAAFIATLQRRARGGQSISKEVEAIAWGLLLSGARPSEIITAPASICSVLPTGTLKIDWPTGKADRQGGPQGRVVFVPEPAASKLVALADGQWLIPGYTKGKHYNPGSLKKPLGKLFAASDAGEATAKTLRKTWRTIASRAGLQEEVVRVLGGWRAGAVMDRVYYHPEEEDLDRAARRVAQEVMKYDRYRRGEIGVCEDHRRAHRRRPGDRSIPRRVRNRLRNDGVGCEGGHKNDPGFPGGGQGGAAEGEPEDGGQPGEAERPDAGEHRKSHRDPHPDRGAEVAPG